MKIMAIFKRTAGAGIADDRPLASQESDRVSAIAAKLDGARALLAALDAESAEMALAAIDRKPGAADKLAAHRNKTISAEAAVTELDRALRLVRRIERADAAESASKVRAEQFAEFRVYMAARHKAMSTIMDAAATMAKAFGEYVISTERARASVPDGTALPDIHVGPNGLYGRSLGSLDRLIMAELWRLAPSRSEDANATIALSFAAPLTESQRFTPSMMPRSLAEFECADAANIKSIEDQLERLKAAALAAIQEAAA